jgi:hypothetical protein
MGMGLSQRWYCGHQIIDPWSGSHLRSGVLKSGYQVAVRVFLKKSNNDFLGLRSTPVLIINFQFELQWTALEIYCGDIPAPCVWTGYFRPVINRACSCRNKATLQDHERAYLFLGLVHSARHTTSRKCSSIRFDEYTRFPCDKR